MPRPLTDSERQAVHAELVRLADELRRLLDDEAGLTDTVTLDQAAVGRVSRVDALQQQEMAKAGRRRVEARLKRVQGALRRYDDDPESLGECADCGEPIALGRMKAFPESVFCVGCFSARGG